MGTAITAVTLPTATGGDGTLSYALTPDITAASGLTLDQRRDNQGDQRHADQGGWRKPPSPGRYPTATATPPAPDEDTITFDVTIAKATQTLSGFTYNPQTTTFGGTVPTLGTVSGNQTTLSYDSDTPLVCAVDEDDGALTIRYVGTCTSRVDAEEDEGYEAATDTFDITVNSATGVPAPSGSNPPASGSSGPTGPEVGEPIAVKLTNRDSDYLVRIQATAQQQGNNSCIGYDRSGDRANLAVPAWKWQRADDMAFTTNVTDIAEDGGPTYIYTPTNADQGKYLRATLTFGPHPHTATAGPFGPVATGTPGNLVTTHGC